MHRQPLLTLLEVHLRRFPDDHLRVDHVRQFVRNHPDCFERSCLEGHVTGSAWIVSADGRQVLLTHHRKLNRWLQLGGHADGDPDPFRVALREAQEESGVEHFATLPALGPDAPLDVDVHVIPARHAEPAHLHHDVRFLLIADPRHPLRTSDESHALRWIPVEDVPRFADEPSLLRMARRAGDLLRAAPSIR